MSSPVVTPAPVVTTVETEAKAVKSWFLLHERLIITLVIIFSLLFIGSKILNHEADKDKAASTAAQQALQLQADANKTLAVAVAQQQVQYSQLVSQVNQQNAALSVASQQRTVVLQTQQATDKTLPMPDLGNRWIALAKLDPASITANTQGVEVSPDAARTTVSQLEEVPVLQQNLSAAQEQNDNLQKVISTSDILNAKLTDQVTGLNTQITDEEVTCKKDLTTAKAEARAGKLHWFEFGFGTGYVAGFVTKVFLK